MKKKKSGKLFIVSAPSGAGKTSLVDNVLRRVPCECMLDRMVTYTSRDMREGEKNGIDFFFISESIFEQKIQEGFFVEWSKAYGSYYGSPNQVVNELNSGRSLILVIDRTGMQQVLNLFINAVTIWIYTPDIQVLRKRLLERGKNTVEQIEKRLKIAAQELREENEKKIYKYKILNDHFDDAVKSFEAILLYELATK